MTQDEIIRMAVKAGFTDYYPERLTRFAALVAAHEREACAKVCEEGTGEAVQKATLEILLNERKRIAKVIRDKGDE